MPQFWDFHRFTTNTENKKNTHTQLHICGANNISVWISKTHLWQHVATIPEVPTKAVSENALWDLCRCSRAVENPSGWFLQHMKSHESCGPNGINKTDGASLWSCLGILAIEDGWFLHSPHKTDYRKRLRYADLATPAKSGLIRLILSLDVVGTTQWDSIEGVTSHSKTIIPTNLCPERFIQAQAWFARFQVLSRKHCHATKQRDAKVCIHRAK